MSPENQPNQPNPTPQDAPQGFNQNPLEQQPPIADQAPQPMPSMQPQQPQMPPASDAVPPQLATAPENAPQPFGPQPMAGPQQPMNPMAPGVPPSGPFMGAPVGQPNPSNGPLGGLDKKLLMWIGGGVGALIIVIIAIVIIVSSLAVSKADYKTAYEYANDARSSYTEMSGLSYISPYSTETETENTLDTFKKSNEEFGKTIKQLGETKAITQDGKAKELYGALIDKKKTFDSAIETTIETYEHIMPAMAEFNSASTSNISKLVNSVDAARSKLEASENKLSSEINKEFASKLAALFKRYSALLKKVEVYRSDYSKYDSKVASDYSSTASEISKTIRDWSSDMRKLGDDAEIKDEFNELGQYLAEKASS